MEAHWKSIVWGQFGAAIDMLENSVRACPEELWADQTRNPQFWYVVYHTLFWLDFYLDDAPEVFAPPAPFNMDETDPAGLMPDRVYTRGELLTYLEHGRRKCRSILEGLNEAQASAPRGLGSKATGTFAELMLYNLRHVQHHTGQLNLILRQTVDAAPLWVARAKDGISEL